VDRSPIVLAHEPPFAIGEAEIRPATREIVHDGAAGIVEPRVMQMLVALHRADGGVVGKDDLIRLCWEGRIVGEDAINRVVSRLRHDAAEKAGGAFRVETITKVGYRLERADGATPTSASATLLDRRRAMWLGAGVIAASATGLVALKQRSGGLSAEARRLIDEGHDALLDGNPEQLATAAVRFREASVVAPNSAESWGGLGLAYARQAFLSPTREGEVMRGRADYARRRALAIDENNGDALAAGIMLTPLFENWLAYEHACRGALRRQPRHAWLNLALSYCMAQVGRRRAALASMERAIDIEPRDPQAQGNLISMLVDLGRLDEAERVADAAIAHWPRHYACWFGRYYLLAFNGRPTEALAMVDDQATRPNGIPDWNWAMTRLQAEAMLTLAKTDVDAAVASAIAAARQGVGFAEVAIMFTGAVGRVEDSYRVIDAYYFDRGFAPGEQRFAKEQGMYSPHRERFTHILFRRFMQPVRADPRFAVLTGALGLDDYWRRSGTRPEDRA
jgi:DNA-binding winged helix-turn-helix (wHTH) protein/Flp pilus assembly protein TadD